MLVYRISRSRYADDLSGTGAGLYGGRWNPVGISLLYTSGSISLSCLEYLVHNFHVMASEEICLTKIQIPDTDAIRHVDAKELPADWKEKTYLPQSTQSIGRQFFEQGKHYLLKVPSAIVPDEFNYLLNPVHPLHKQTKIKDHITPFVIDERLF